MKTLHKKRLLKLAAFLRTVPDENFNMCNWLTPDRNLHKHSKASLKCGTAACVGGWATVVFRDLVYSWPKNIIYLKSEPKSKYWCDSETNLKKFFGLDSKESERLFLMSFYKTAKEKAKEIEDLVETHLND